jgi:predicted Ser/Thr protein kinase/tetratricopeptide (TPR) repeat protein
MEHDTSAKMSPTSAPARDLDGEAMRRRIHARLFGGNAEAVLIGRFQVLETLGQGGMGVVYAAEDAQLGRQIALKVIRDDVLRGDAGERARLLREARALAKLSHPNVVQVHEVGEHEGAVFIVMELVRGTTLGQWLAAGTRPLAAVLDRFIEAARGLDAAHRVGIVHRDFKPTNALVGADERVRIVDFGLARDDPRESDVTPGQRQEHAIQVRGALTPTATRAGTPAYMSPEQAMGAHCDARSDQFSFCVALFEAVYGRRPFAPGELLSALEQPGEWRSPVPPGGPAPRWLRRVLTRGLSLRPEERFPSMTAVIDLLLRAPRQRRRQAVALGALAALAAAVTAGRLLFQAPAPEGCPDPRERLAGVWGPSQREGLQKSFAVTQVQQLGSDRTERALDEYAGRWADATRDACEATLVRHEQPQARLDQSSQCLDRARRAFANLIGTLMAADPALLAESEALVAGLPDPAHCRDPTVLDGPPPRVDPELETLLDRAQILETTQQGAEALAVLNLAVARARERGDDGGEAAALLLLGKTHAHLLRDPGAAREALHQAYDRAAQAGRTQLESTIWRELAWVTSYELGLAPEARVWLEHARGAQGEHADPSEQAALLAVEAQILETEDRPAEAVQVRGQVLAMLQAIYPLDHPELVLARQALAVSYGHAGSTKEALDLHASLWRELGERHGSEHPWTARCELDLGLDYVELERYQEARPHIEHARQILAATHGEANPRVATADLKLAELDLNDGAIESGLARAQQALAVYGEHFPRWHGDRVSTLVLLSWLYLRANELAPLLAVSLELLAIHDAGYPDNIDLPGVLTNIGEILCELGRCAESLPYFGRLMALHVQDPPTGDDAVLRAFPLHGIGRVHLGTGKPALALPFLEEARTILTSRPPDREGMDAVFISCTRHLADALQALGQAPKRVRDLRREANKLEASRP